MIGETAGLSSGYFLSDLREETVILGQGDEETNLRLTKEMASSVQNETKYQGDMEIGSGDKGVLSVERFSDAWDWCWYVYFIQTAVSVF